LSEREHESYLFPVDRRKLLRAAESSFGGQPDLKVLISEMIAKFIRVDSFAIDGGAHPPLMTVHRPAT